ncbi:uncharacterized protein BDZ99DRAFT_401338, partial [Mytilinidion resinicola]
FNLIINIYLIEYCALNPLTLDCISLVIYFYYNYFSFIRFPAIVDLALRVNKLGKSSITYEIKVFKRGEDTIKIVKEFIYIFINRNN